MEQYRSPEVAMYQSPEINELAAAIVKAQLALVPAAKDHVNPFFKSKYADLPTVWEAAGPFREQGVAITQSPMDAPDGYIVLDTQLSHTSGQWMRSRLKIRVAKDDPQGYGSALTYARRYALGCMTGIVTEEDDDGNAASQPQKAQVFTQHKQTAQAKLHELKQEPARQDGGEHAEAVLNTFEAARTQQGPDAAAPCPWTVPKVAWAKTNAGKRPDELDDNSLSFFINYYETKLGKEPQSRYRLEWDEALRALVAEAMQREQAALPMGGYG